LKEREFELKKLWFNVFSSQWSCNTHFFSRIKFCANRGAYKNAYQIIAHMKNPQKNKSCTGCNAWHDIFYFSKILEEPRRI
jgi:hypothetical protein